MGAHEPPVSGNRRTTDRQLPALIESIYDAGTEPDHWPSVLTGFADLFGASCAVLVLTGPGKQIRQIGSFGCDPSFRESYEEYYGCLDPVVPVVAKAPCSLILTDSMVVPRAKLERNEFHHDWVRPQGYNTALAANIAGDDRRVGVIVLSRSQQGGDFYQSDVDVLATLMPHLRRAIKVHLRLADARSRQDTLTAGFDRVAHAVLMIDAYGRVLFANRAAERVLAQADGLDVGPGGLRAATTTQTSDLRRLVALATTKDRLARQGGALLIDRPSMRRPFQVLISPLRHSGTAMVLVIDPERKPADSAQRLASLYKLTPAETQVAREIAKGEGLPGVANRLGVLLSTVRTHLHHVFEKTATTRQAELVRLLEVMALAGDDEAPDVPASIK